MQWLGNCNHLVLLFMSSLAVHCVQHRRPQWGSISSLMNPTRISMAQGTCKAAGNINGFTRRLLQPSPASPCSAGRGWQGALLVVLLKDTRTLGGNKEHQPLAQYQLGADGTFKKVHWHSMIKFWSILYFGRFWIDFFYNSINLNMEPLEK